MQRSRTFRRWTPVTTWLPPPPQAGLPPRARIAFAAFPGLPALLRAGRFSRARLPLATGAVGPAPDPAPVHAFDATAGGAQYNTRLDN